MCDYVFDFVKILRYQILKRAEEMLSGNNFDDFDANYTFKNKM